MYEKEDLSIRAISRMLGHSRRTIRKYVSGSEGGYNRKEMSPRPKVDKVKPIVEAWYFEDQEAPRKQRRTAKKMHEDLRNEYGYDCGYSTVKTALFEVRGSTRDVFIPRAHKPGEYVEFDFGELMIEVNGERIKVYLHAFQLTCSNDKFGYLSLRQNQEEMFFSHRKAFEHFGGVPQNMRYDNLTLAVKKILRGGKRKETDNFKTFRDQFGFESEFCAPGKGNQKGDVEGCVGFVRRNFLTPVPKLQDLNELDRLNDELADWCRSLRETKTVPGTGKTVQDIFLQEKGKLLLLPQAPYDVGKWACAKSNHYSLVCIDASFYSVPVNYAHQTLDVLITAREIIVSQKDTVIARHKRTFEKGKQIFDPIHYLPLFRKKPHALINSKPITELPDSFSTFFHRAKLKGYGTLEDCIPVLKLIKDHGVKDVSVALELAMTYDTYYLDGIKNLLFQVKTGRPVFEKLAQLTNPSTPNPKIPDVDLKRYDTLTTGGHVS